MGSRAALVLASPPVVSVVVVNWNAGGALARCLASLAADAAAGIEVVVVDNASTDGSADAALAAYPWVRRHASGANVGFARGANAGAGLARGDVLVFLNPDAAVAPGALATLVGALAATPEAGIAGGGLVDEDGSWQPAAARFGVLPHLVCDTSLGRLGARRRRRVHSVDWVYGTFMAVRRDVFDGLGGFDGSYFLYGEDLDLCHRVRAAGYRVVYFADATITHRGNRSGARRWGTRRDVEVLKGTLRFFRRRRGAGAERAFRMLAGGGFALKAALATFGAMTGARDGAARGRLYARLAWLCATGDPAARRETAPAMPPLRVEAPRRS
jgi:GT2 family glycosyltransferase